MIVSRKPSSKRSSNPPPTALIYRGPSRVPQSKVANDVETLQVQFIGTIASSAGGVISSVITPYSQLTSSPDWTSITNLYTEFRILSIETTFVPWNLYNTPTTTTLAPIYSVVDRSNSTALSSLANAAEYASVQIHEPSKKFKRVAKMAGSGEADWALIGSGPAAAAQFYIKLYSGGNTASTTTHDYLSILMVQFRGRK